MKKFLVIPIFATATILSGCASSSSFVDQNNRNASIHLELASGYYSHHQFSVALDEIKQTLHIEPNNAQAYGLRGLVYMGMEENALADENFQRGLNLAPNDPEINNNYGWFLCQSGQVTQSLGYFEAAVKNHEYASPEKALTNAGICSLKLKDKAAALKYFMRAFQLDPDNPVTNANIAQLYYDMEQFERARFYVKRVAPPNEMPANVLLLAFNISKKMQDHADANILAAQLKKRFPNSPEYSTLQHDGFNE